MKKVSTIVLCAALGVSSLYPTLAHAELFAPHDCNALHSTDLVSELNDQVDSRIAGLGTSAGYGNIFTDRGNGSGGWGRNSSVFTERGDFPLDLTGVSPWNSSDGFRKAGTLISPKHIVFASHFPLANGTTLAFIDSTGAVVTRTLQAQAYIFNSDVKVGILNEVVPSTVAFYPILDKDEISYYFSTTTGMPVIVTDQEGKALVRDVYEIGNQQIKRTTHFNAQSLPRLIFTETLVTGDSGQPGFLAAGDQLILNFTNKGSASGVAQENFIPLINAAMAAIGGPEYQVSRFDLSCFTSGRIYLAHQAFFVSQAATQGQVVGTTTATGLFSSNTPTYSILSGNDEGVFSIGTLTGAISVLNPSLLSFKLKPVHLLIVQAGSAQVRNNIATTTVKIVLQR